MIFHETPRQVQGAGSWDRNTGRYIPITGGSRSRLPIKDTKIPRYYGFVGVDERLSESMGSVRALYKHLGGRAIVEGGKGGELTSKLLTATDAQVAAQEAEAAEKKKGAPAE